MCGRFTSLLSAELLAATFGVPAPAEVVPRYNIAPTQQVPVIREHPDHGLYLSAVRWGQVPSWANDLSIGNSLINTLAENFVAKPVFKHAFRSHRCIIPASGFYVWQDTGGKKQPWYITRKDGDPLALAGLLEQWKSPGGREVETCTIITVAANAAIRHLHDRMPAILELKDFPLWLIPSPMSSASLRSILMPLPPGALDVYSVRSLVNNPACDSVDCIEHGTRLT